MDYGNHRATSTRFLNKQACARFIAKADIANFYPSLYTHSIPWAIVGIDNAKGNTNASIWYNALDRDIRNCRRGETNGVSIGPGTSSLVAEIVLSQIDRKLEKRFSFDRFIDDYTCYTNTRGESEEFLRALEAELARYNLFLNFKKTRIFSLPASEIPQWIDQLSVDVLGAAPTFYQVKVFLSRALHLSEEYPDGSVLRYAIHSLVGRSFDPKTGDYILRLLFSFGLAHPHVVASIDPFLKFGYDNSGAFKYSKEVISLVNASAMARRSDAICWSLWIARQTNTNLPPQIEMSVLRTYDTFGLVALYQVASAQTRRLITLFVKTRVLSRPHSILERNWFLVHYLLNTNRLTVAEVPDASLRVLKTHGVNMFE